jgi:hypothetical protein
MVFEFDVLRVVADEFTLQDSSAILVVGKAQTELWLPLCLGSAL